jgi:hypothetical protein
LVHTTLRAHASVGPVEEGSSSEPCHGLDHGFESRQARQDYIFAPHGSPPAGPCLVCGRHPDKRHRLWDAIKDMFVAGDSLDELAEEYGYTRLEIEQWLRLALTDLQPVRKKRA